MDTRKRNRTEVAVNANAGFKKSKPEMDSLSSGIGSKTKPCTKFFSMAGCPFGESCHFLHFYPGGYKAVAEMMNLEPLPASRNVTSAVAATPNGSTSTVLKSKLCTKYNTAERCKFGDKCHFAHGEWELNKPMAAQPQDDMRTLVGVQPLFGRGSMPGVSGPPAGFGASATTKISVASSLAGPIIGKSGVNSKMICQKTGVKLGVREHESDPNLRNIELEGTLDQIQQASSMVKELIASLVSAGVGVGVGGGGGGGGGVPARSNGETTPMTMPPVASKYKTKLCENFAKGSCTFGDRCHFAHGASQLRQSGV